MNIFVVDKDPKVAARSLCDQHVVKMLIENCQMLSAVMDVTYEDKHRSLIEPHAQFGLANYPKSVKKHPCTLWLMESINNVKWLIAHHYEMLSEYTRRYHKVHKYGGTAMIYEAQLQYCNLPGVKRTPFVNANTNFKHIEDTVEAYRTCYNLEKSKFARYKYTMPPAWFMPQ
jgi:hypothetical protein